MKYDSKSVENKKVESKGTSTQKPYLGSRIKLLSQTRSQT
jgi:hypothetical protein